VRVKKDNIRGCALDKEILEVRIRDLFSDMSLINIKGNGPFICNDHLYIWCNLGGIESKILLDLEPIKNCEYFTRLLGYIEELNKFDKYFLMLRDQELREGGYEEDEEEDGGEEVSFPEGLIWGQDLNVKRHLILELYNLFGCNLRITDQVTKFIRKDFLTHQGPIQHYALIDRTQWCWG
jgi:hypothetical protein